MRILYTLFALLMGSAASADTLTLRDGRVIHGNFLGGTSRQLQMETGGQVETFDITRIATLSFANQGVTVGSSRVHSGRTGNIELAAGTTFVVRMIDAVDSEKDRVGQTFRASLDEPVFDNAQPVIPRGADVVIKLVDSKESGKIAGRSTLTLNLQSVFVTGRMVDINTQSVTQVSSSRGARTAKTTAAAAGVGAVIGAIAGGGKGAAIGAGAGAGVGLGAEVLTKGQKVQIPSETRLSFVLDVPVRLQVNSE